MHIVDERGKPLLKKKINGQIDFSDWRGIFRGYAVIPSSSFSDHNKKFSLFRFCANKLCITTIKIANAVDFYAENINHTIGSAAKIEKSLQLCFRISCFLLYFATKSVQNNQNLTFWLTTTPPPPLKKINK